MKASVLKTFPELHSHGQCVFRMPCVLLVHISGRPAASVAITEKEASSEKTQSSSPLAVHLLPARLQHAAFRWLVGTSVSALLKTVCLL